MGNGKYSYRKLNGIKDKVIARNLKEKDAPKFVWGMPVEWNEFNKVYHGKSNFVISVPHDMFELGIKMVGMYSAMKMAFDNRFVGVFTRWREVLDWIEPVYDSIVLNKDRKSRKERFIRQYHDAKIPREVDDVVYYLHDDPLFDLKHIEYALDAIQTKNGWNDWKTKKLVIVIDSEMKDVIEGLKSSFPGCFRYIEYDEEKSIVDKWCGTEESFIDPMFDMKLLDNRLNLKHLFLYMATNHRYRFREYARFNREMLDRYFNREDIAELM